MGRCPASRHGASGMRSFGCLGALADLGHLKLASQTLRLCTSDMTAGIGLQDYYPISLFQLKPPNVEIRPSEFSIHSAKLLHTGAKRGHPPARE